MTTDTLTLTDFLLARIAEGEEVVRRAKRYDLDKWTFVDAELLSFPPPTRTITTVGRVLADCEAKRRIAEEHALSSDGIYTGCSLCDHNCETGGDLYRDGPCNTLRFLAAVYADHPDYRDEWRP